MTWQTQAVLTIRSLIGDLDPASYQYTDERLTQLFMISGQLVLMDTSFDNDYVIDVALEDISPDPSLDLDFMGLTSLRAACILASSEVRTKAGATGNHSKVTMKDGPSTITVDNADGLNSLKTITKSACDRYAEALFLFKAGKSVGKAILGPHSPASHGLTTDRQERSIY